VRRWVTIAFALGALALGCTPKPDPFVDAGPKAEAPVPAPDGLLGEGVLTAPNATWSKLQQRVGGPLAILPMTFGGLVCTWAGLDSALANDVDGVSPAFIVASGKATEPGFVLAVKLADDRHARSVLFDGETARYRPREDGGVVFADGKNGPLTYPVALTKNGWLVVGKSDGDVKALAAYATRTLPQRPLPKEALVADLPRPLFAHVAGKLEALWKGFAADLEDADQRARKAHGGRPPDFGDPAAVIAQIDGFTGRRLAELRDVSKAHVTADVDEGGLRAELVLTPSGEGGPLARYLSGVTPGAAAPVLGASGDAEIALLLRDDAKSRAEDARALDTALTSALGGRLAEADKKKVGQMLADWQRGRSDELVVTLTRAPAKGAVLRTRVADREALQRALRAVPDVLKLPAIKEPLRIKEVTSKNPEVAELGKVEEVVAELAPAKPDPHAKKKPDPSPQAYGLAWAIKDDVAVLGAGEDPARVLASLGKVERTLGDDRVLAGPVNNLGEGVSLVVVAQPLKLDPSRLGAPPAPVVVTWGKKGNEGVVRAFVASPVLKELVKRQMFGP
jgi:hypothetical protein